MVFHSTGEKIVEYGNAILFFFLYLGHLIYSFFHTRSIVWRHTLITTLRAGSRMVLPLMIVSMLIGISLAFSIHYILARFNLENEAISIAQSTIVRDAAPLLIGFVLSVHCSLNLINPDHPSLRHPPQIVLYETIIPLIFSINCTALLLYAYVTASFFMGIYFIFNYFLHINIQEYVLRLNNIIFSLEIVQSLGKTLLYATIASFTAGYYYYDVASRVLSTRTAVSRIITRGLFWLVVVSVFMKIQ